MTGAEHFVNEGFGWECKHCRESGVEPIPSSSEPAPMSDAKLPRFFREGEAEEPEPRLSASALARWKDETRRTLRCTHCGVEEEIVR
jgi:hypothetical protein